MEPYEIKKLSELENRLDEIYVSVEKTRKYFMWTLIITVLALLLPLLGITLLGPSFIDTYTTNLNSITEF